jgi:DNA-binding phage protein
MHRVVGVTEFTKSSTFHVVEYLDCEEAISAYLDEVLAEDDQPFLLSALEDVARSRRYAR